MPFPCHASLRPLGAPLASRSPSAQRGAWWRRAPLAPAVLALLAATGCAGPSQRAEDPRAGTRPGPTREAARDLAYTERSEIRFDGELVGYLIEVQPVPAGIRDQRAFEPGTALIEDAGMQLVGFISPGGTTYRYDEDALPRRVGFGSRSAGIAAFFRRNGEPQLVPPHVGGA